MQIENISRYNPGTRFKEILLSNKLPSYDFLSNIEVDRIRKVDPEILYYIAYHSKPLQAGPVDKEADLGTEILSDPSIGDSLMLGTLPKRKDQLPETMRLILCLNDVIFPDNVGSMIQSAHSIGGVDAIIGTEKTCDFYGWKVLEASRGLGYQIPKQVISKPDELLSVIKKHNLLPIVGDANEGQDISNLDIKDYSGIAVIVGNEKHGPTPPVRDMAVKVRIPIDIHSLNVGVAGGILLQIAKSVLNRNSLR